MSLYKTQAVVLAAKPFGEADRIVTLFTLAKGKVRAVAKGSRRPKNRLAGLTQIFTLSEMQLFAGKSLDTISQGQILNPFLTLRADLDRMAYGVYLLELIDRATEGITEYQDYFVLLLTALELCQHSDDLPLARLIIEARLLTLMGYRPELSRCVRCGTMLLPSSQMGYSVHDGGVICPRCQVNSSDRLTVTAGTIASLEHLLRTDPKRLHQLKLGTQQRQEIVIILAASLELALGGPIKSSAFLLDLAQMPLERVSPGQEQEKLIEGWREQHGRDHSGKN